MCYCDTPIAYENCCGLFHALKQYPQTPLALMRSRYSAYVLHLWDYVQQTMQENFIFPSTSPCFVRLEIIDARENQVEFKAYYLQKNKLDVLHEKSDFASIKGKWIYLSGQLFDEPAMMISRNEKCPCLSNKKFKNCHGATQ